MAALFVNSILLIVTDHKYCVIVDRLVYEFIIRDVIKSNMLVMSSIILLLISEKH